MTSTMDEPRKMATEAALGHLLRGIPPSPPCLNSEKARYEAQRAQLAISTALGCTDPKLTKEMLSDACLAIYHLESLIPEKEEVADD